MWPFPGKKLEHPTFGTLRPYRGGHFWRARVEFEPVGDKIWLSIHAGARGPTQAQEKLYLTLFKKYETILPKLLGPLHHEYERVRKLHIDAHWPKTAARDLPTVIPLHSIWLEEGSGHPFVLSYQSERDKDHEFHVFFRNGKLHNVAYER